MLGAIGEQLGKNPSVLRPLRLSLNPLSRFDFGALAGLTFARKWQAKNHRRPCHVEYAVIRATGHLRRPSFPDLQSPDNTAS
jgi:hypothetical protein